MKSRIHTILLVFLLGTCCAAQANGHTTQKPFVPVVSDLRVNSRTPIHLDNAQIVILRDGRRRTVNVSAQLVTYGCGILKVNDAEKRNAGERTLFCCEVTAKDVADTYSWYSWSYSATGQFRLFNTPDGHNYLAWASGGDLCFAEISQPTDRLSMLDALLAVPTNQDSQGVTRVPVMKLVPETEGCRWGVNALYFEIVAISIATDQHGNWVVQVSPPKSDKVCKVFTMVSDATCQLGWRYVD